MTKGFRWSPEYKTVCGGRNPDFLMRKEVGLREEDVWRLKALARAAVLERWCHYNPIYKQSPPVSGWLEQSSLTMGRYVTDDHKFADIY